MDGQTDGRPEVISTFHLSWKELKIEIIRQECYNNLENHMIVYEKKGILLHNQKMFYH